MRWHFVISMILSIFCASHVAGQGLLFDHTEWDFGRIAEADGKVSHAFPLENRGETPVVITDVVASCGCTVPRFSRKPILAGERSEIVVTFDPSNRPGVFVKELTVFGLKGEKLARLCVRGDVTPRNRPPEELYPCDMGSGLRLDADIHAFSYLYHDRVHQTEIGCTNTSKSTIRLQLTAEEPSGFLKFDYPATLAPGEQGRIVLAYDVGHRSGHYGTVSDRIRVTVDAEPVSRTIRLHGIAVDDPYAGGESAARLQIDKPVLHFGSVRRAASPRCEATLSNEGEDALIVRAVELPDALSCSLQPGERIAPGAERRVEFVLATDRLDRGTNLLRAMIVTNDPVRPMRTLRATVDIED